MQLNDIPESAIWEFDIDSKRWSKLTDFNYTGVGTKIDRPGAAAYCDAPALNKSFVFEGYVQQRSDHDYITYDQSSEFKCMYYDHTKLFILILTYSSLRGNACVGHEPCSCKANLDEHLCACLIGR